MQTHRGTTQATLNGYRLTLMALLHRLGDQPERFEAQALRAFVLERAGQGGIGRAKTIVTAVRMFLRFLIAIGRCHPGPGSCPTHHCPVAVSLAPQVSPCRDGGTGAGDL